MATKKKAAKLDLVKEHPECYGAKKAPEIVKLPPALYISIEGKGAPESGAFQEAMGALYGVAYTVKMRKKSEGNDFKVSPLEGLWWADYDTSGLEDPDALWTVPREEWKWKLIIRQPDFVKKADVARAVKALIEKKGDEVHRRVKLEKIGEGKCVQILHVGPYSDEPESIRRMRALMEERDLKPRGRHHEIYLNDPRRTAPGKLKTILRQPVK